MKEKKKLESAAIMPKTAASDEPFDIDTFEIKTLADFDTYNFHARKLKRKVRLPDGSFYKKVKVKFQRFDQPQNILKAYVRRKEIEWKGQLKPGRIYELPLPVVKYLNALATPIFAEVKVEDGGEVISKTEQVGEQCRFACQIIDME